MRKKTQEQMPLMITTIDHPQAVELEGINRILDDNPIIDEMVWWCIIFCVNSERVEKRVLSV